MSNNDNNNNDNKHKIKALNIANIVAYLANVAVTYGVGVSGRFPTNAEISAKYQSLVTPAGYAFAIWGIIFIAQFIWSIVQVTPKFRSNPLVIHNNNNNNDNDDDTPHRAVGYLYIAVCVAQILWTIMFALELIPLSFVAMISILIPLVWIVQRHSLKTTTSSSTTFALLEYWLLQFPFEIHCGWIWAASLVNLNVVLVSWNTSSTVQTIFAWISIVCLALITIYYLFKQKWIIPLVLAWASYGIHVALESPKESIATFFSQSTINAIEKVSKWLALAIVISTVVLFLVAKFVHGRKKKNNHNNNNNHGSRVGNEEPLVNSQNKSNQN